MIPLFPHVPTALFWRTHKNTRNLKRAMTLNGFEQVETMRFIGRKPLILHPKKKKPLEILRLGAV